ncbi:S8 family peptidase [Sphingomonas sp. SAFR-052]|uniref:S8 family peptidase n=1 Tax=Sphingomonas sp. SAFR-052 TaxID=3436867 RepID=UPI003F7F3C5E
MAEALSTSADEQTRHGVDKDAAGGSMRIEGRPGQELDIGTGRAEGRGTMQVLNARRAVRGEGRNLVRDVATVFVTERNLEKLLVRLDKYEAYDGEDDRGGRTAKRPDSFWLFEGAETFRPARLEDFWTDDLSSFPSADGAAIWEVWVREGYEGPFREALKQLKLSTEGAPSRFVDVSIWSVRATRQQLRRLIDRSAAVVELRGASSFSADHRDLPPAGRLADAETLARRIRPAAAEAPRVTLLDTGVNRANPLLRRSLPLSRCHAAIDGWDRLDFDGHGTKMAGVALFGDLADVAGGAVEVRLEAALESVVVTAPPGNAALPARNAIERAVSIVEDAEKAGRVFCLAATAPGEATDGRPSSTSSTLDKLAFGNARDTRLFCAAVGNVSTDGRRPYLAADYATLNEDHGIQSPAQALNALSVGAITHKCSGRGALAAEGDLSPTSRTALAWEFRRNKPDIVMEGGNHVLDPGGQTSRFHGPDMVETTSRDVAARPITTTGETSAATAAAAGLAARLLARYPSMRAETIRGLMVHSASWTDAMLARHAAKVAEGLRDEQAWLHVLDCFGWGLPNEERLFWSAGNALTLVVEDELRPYKHEQGKSVTLREMKHFRLPWPRAALAALGSAPVELRCTLSYFVEPDPHSASRARPELYPSHRLRFDFRRHDETERQALARVNRAFSSDGVTADDAGWTLGSRFRSRGTLHHDIWRGRAYELADRGGVSVVPNRGWWADRPDLSPENRRIRFSLIVSVRTPETPTDIHAEALAQVPTGILVANSP